VLYFSVCPETLTSIKALDELDAGVCDGMTYEEIEVGVQTLPYCPGEGLTQSVID
jgi:hypothetical protein